MKSHGPWKIKSTEQVYKDPFVELTLDKVIRPDGDDGQHIVVHIKPGVCVIAVDADRNVHLTKEFHYAVGRYTIEGVSGGVEPGEYPDRTAKRELQEELGLEAAKWQFLMTTDPMTACLASPVRLYLATVLSEVDTNPEGTELIEHVVMPLVEATALVASGEITHSPSCVAILLANSLIAE
jgi:ADP-ribose pyrophosphatase